MISFPSATNKRVGEPDYFLTHDLRSLKNHPIPVATDPDGTAEDDVDEVDIQEFDKAFST